jgi:hypothetical protein
MGKSNLASNGLLNLIFAGTTFAGIAQNVAAGALTTFYIALHTADPTAAGNQTSSEAAYVGYARVAVARTSAGWTTATAESVNPQAPINFPPGTGGSGTATFWSIGTAISGAGSILYSGPISPSIVMGSGITPQLTTASIVTES